MDAVVEVAKYPSCPSRYRCYLVSIAGRTSARGTCLQASAPEPRIYSVLSQISGRCLFIATLLTGENKLTSILETKSRGLSTRFAGRRHSGAGLLLTLRFQ
jgi:hypothetical protein